MRLAGWMITGSIKRLGQALCRVYDQELEKIPARGPLILVSNHINFLDVPVLYTHLLPRPLVGFAKIETWDNPLLRPLANLWEAIPIRRGEADMQALRRALQALKEGKILGMSPEGTRSGDGCLRRGNSGVVLLAQMSGAPILPMAFYGIEQFHTNIRRLRRTDFHIKVGRMLRLKESASRLSREQRMQAVDEIMCQIAALMPSPYRGFYAQADSQEMQYWEYT
jgi:1-acyl-sn-glycerol-3-phosphate acyltransferase